MFLHITASQRDQFSVDHRRRVNRVQPDTAGWECPHSNVFAAFKKLYLKMTLSCSTFLRLHFTKKLNMNMPTLPTYGCHMWCIRVYH